MPAYKLLIITQNPGLFDELILQLDSTGFQLCAMVNFIEAIDAQFSFKPDAVIIDSSSDPQSALEICVSIKSFNRINGSLIMVVSNRKEDNYEISAFQSGADDFMLLPLRIKVMIERMKARLNKPGSELTIVQGYSNSLPLRINRDSYSVALGDNFIQLSRKEFDLLYIMASNPNKMFDRQELFESVWNKKFTSQNRTLDVYMSKLRQKIGTRFISNQKGVGYRFVS